MFHNCIPILVKIDEFIIVGLWASLALELLYLTNDDDERYSIQAEERILRNKNVFCKEKSSSRQ